MMEVDLNPELLRQIDLVELSPKDHASLVQQALGNKAHGMKPYGLFWWCLNYLAAMAQDKFPQILPELQSIYSKSFGIHYIEAGIRNGLITPKDVVEGEETKDGLQPLPQEGVSNEQVPRLIIEG